jgi:PKHD-type hydroxylase
MMLHIPGVLAPDQTAQFRQDLQRADWTDGRATAGHLSAQVKDNQQLREDHPLARRLGEVLLSAVERNAQFMSAALPARIVPPLFNRHAGGQSYGRHIDGSIRPVAGSPVRVRTDLAATLFLSQPADYDGGELVIEGDAGIQRIKLPAGDLILYPATTVHQVTAVTRGERLASFFWIESLVREAGRRRMLFDLDKTIQALTAESASQESVLQLTALYHNLMREWGDA